MVANDEDSYVLANDPEQEMIWKAWQVDAAEFASLIPVSERCFERF